MAQHDEIEKDQYAKIEVLTKSVSELTGAVSVLNKTNTDLVATLRRTNFYQFLTIVFLIAVIAYGAIGERGMYAKDIEKYRDKAETEDFRNLCQGLLDAMGEDS